MKYKVYVETSFISYLVGRLKTDLITLQRQLSSQLWWQRKRNEFQLFASQAVYRECIRGDAEMVQERLALLEEVALLPLTGEILELAERLVAPAGPLSKKSADDAIHIAAATVYGCEFLLTWNFKHINNAFIRPEIERIIASHGYRPPNICSADELMGSDEPEG
jgi:predicted nucleic acid-binding protein